MNWQCIVIAGCLILGGCASSNQASEQAQAADYQSNQVAVNEEGANAQPAISNTGDEVDDNDPLESFNRVMWDFNWDILDQYLLRPTAVAYRNNVPQFMRTGILNAAQNLDEPANFVNNFLQGEFEYSFGSLGRFVINSTLGLVGTIDVAQEMGLSRHRERFGEVLGSYGVGTGPYVMLPALGPNDPRSITGTVVDNFYFPIQNGYFAILTGFAMLETRADLVAQEELINNSVDPYAFVRDVYFQQLENDVNNGAVQEKTQEEQEFDEELDAYLDEL